MAYNGTEEERAARVAQELIVKLKLENATASKLRTLFRHIAKDVTKVYSATGTVIDAELYRSEVEGILKTAYRRSMEYFGSDLSDHLKENAKNGKDPLIAALYLLAIQRDRTVEQQIRIEQTKKDNYLHEYMNEVVPEKADQITQTNNKRIAESVAFAAGLSAISEKPQSQHEIAVAAGKDFWESNEYRGQLIAQDAVSDGSESAKLIEVSSMDETLNEVRNQGIADVQAIKTWVTAGDDKVREAHIEADGQEQNIDDAFEVDGELLMKPRDTSLGASAGNTINCRCSAVYTFDGDVVRESGDGEDSGFFAPD